MESPKPGTPEYRQIVKKKMLFNILVFFVGIIGLFVMGTLVYFDAPQTEPARLLTGFSILCFLALSAVTLLAGITLILSVWAQTRLSRLRDNQSRKNTAE